MTTEYYSIPHQNGSRRSGPVRTGRPANLAGMTVGILDISKSRGNVYLDRLDEILSSRGVTIRRYMKPTFARPAPTALMQTIAGECEVIIEGLAD